MISAFDEDLAGALAVGNTIWGRRRRWGGRRIATRDFLFFRAATRQAKRGAGGGFHRTGARDNKKSLTARMIVQVIRLASLG
jgi:hypothetical protein